VPSRPGPARIWHLRSGQVLEWQSPPWPCTGLAAWRHHAGPGIHNGGRPVPDAPGRAWRRLVQSDRANPMHETTHPIKAFFSAYSEHVKRTTFTQEG